MNRAGGLSRRVHLTRRRRAARSAHRFGAGPRRAKFRSGHRPITGARTRLAVAARGTYQESGFGEVEVGPRPWERGRLAAGQACSGSCAMLGQGRPCDRRRGLVRGRRDWLAIQPICPTGDLWPVHERQQVVASCFPGGGLRFLASSLLTRGNKEYIVDTKAIVRASVGRCLGQGTRSAVSPGGPQASPNTRLELGIWCGVLGVGRGSGTVGARRPDMAVRPADAVDDADRP
jgi:hypothetical protein